MHLSHETRASISAVDYSVAMTVGIGGNCRIKRLLNVAGSPSQLSDADTMQPAHVSVSTAVCSRELGWLPCSLLQRLAVIVHLLEGESLVGCPLILVDGLEVRFYLCSE